MQHQEYEDEEEEEEEIDLESIEDEQTLIEMLDETEDIDERKKIRDRLRQVQYVLKAQKEEQRKKRENEREQRIRDRQREAELKKQQTLQMYSEMAKQGGPARRISDNPGEKKKDLVEDAIRDRLKACEDRKKRILAAYDHAAKSQPAGGARVVEFDSFRSADVSKLEPKKPVQSSCTFGMSGGIPKVEKAPVVSVPKTRVPEDDSHLDPMERAIRARVREAEERKRRTLAAYDMAARTGGAGPKTVILEEFRNVEINDKPKPKYDPCFRGLKT
ncbi:splicing regulatory glutamine/lysine-rich protein 1-like [Argiope bruennichi]|uniref:Smoothelin domain-containing protein n=1 Tax=Argiope bruennichi TaxID=94029 RepID=A0A8T0FSX4_ARGBR|nr:splicing regulatory glutamine/lysine-rich protein 1-like [Argiope bruennichi]KAF8794257.1 hypothetical protein HNY73_002254 [Argiope bruennichi]